MNHLSFLLTGENFVVEPAENISREHRIATAQAALVSGTVHFSLGMLSSGPLVIFPLLTIDQE
jgi:hypothetical protein